MFYETACLMDELSKELGLPTALDYADLAARIKEAFNRHFWLADLHRYSTWGTCGVALMTGLYPDGERDALVKALLELMEADNYAMSTGIYGNKYLIPALSVEGYGDIALKYMFNRGFHSFGTMLDKGATSLWECLEHDFTMPREVGTASYNHPMHSGFAYFLYAYVGGIKPLTPGFATFEVSPCDYEGIPSATVSHVSPFGEIKVDFKREAGKTVYTVTVPAGSVGYFRKGDLNEKMGSGVHTITVEA
jgi:alpha-L-rhamnosidase